MTQIPAILIGAPRSASESAPVAENATDTSSTGTFDAALALAVGQFALPIARPLESALSLPAGTQPVASDEHATDAAGITLTEVAAPLPAAGLSQTLSRALASRAGAPATGGPTMLRVAPDSESAEATAAPHAKRAVAADAPPSGSEGGEVSAAAVPGGDAVATSSLARLTDAAPVLATAAQTLAQLESAARIRIEESESVMRPPVVRNHAPSATGPTGALQARAIPIDARDAAPATLPDETTLTPLTSETAKATMGAVLRGAASPARAVPTGVSHAVPGSERGEDLGLAARVVSSAIAGEPADSRAARAGLRRAARGAAIASAITEGVKATTAARTGATPARADGTQADPAPRSAKPVLPTVRGVQNENTTEPAAAVVTDERVTARESAQLVAAGAGVSRASETTTAAAVARVAVAAEEPVLAPRSGDRVTLNLQGENGVEGRLRVAMRGEQVHATLVSNDGTTVENWTAGIDQLRRALGERGFAEPRLAIQQAVRTDVADTHASERGEQRAPREGQRDPHSGGTSRESQEERQARRQPRQQSQKEPS